MISFFYEEIDFRLSESKSKKWIEKVVKHHKAIIDEINYIFCTDNYLLEINQQYLNHDYYTDIISFDNSVGSLLSADIYISIDRVIANAKTYNVSLNDELDRVLIHGILHLLGYKDKSLEEEKIMRKTENDMLKLRTYE